MEIKYFIFLLFQIFCFTIAKSQAVFNDDIENRHNLKINSKPHISHTEESTVQRECLNIPLTDQCLIYHNDQWFEFTTLDTNIYYLNIRNQDCRDIRGVQAVIFDGEACRPETYKLIKCISNGHQDDVYTKLELERNKSYLLLIDGYLHDNCYFDIDISTNLPDFAIIPDSYSEFDTIQSNEAIVKLEWHVDSLTALEIYEYQILRRYQNSKKSQSIWSSPALRNSMGEAFLDYSWSDTLNDKEGKYYYKVLAMGPDSSMHLIKSVLYEYSSKEYKNDPRDNFIVYDLPNTKRGNLYVIELRDKKSDLLLEKKSIQYDKLFSEIKIDITKYRKMGIVDFELQVKNRNDNKTFTVHFNRPYFREMDNQEELW